MAGWFRRLSGLPDFILAALAQEKPAGDLPPAGGGRPPGLPAGAIGQHLAMPGATLSFHLTQLRQSGLVRRWRNGRSVVYAADFPTMSALMGFLTENCCRGDARRRPEDFEHATPVR